MTTPVTSPALKVCPWGPLHLCLSTHASPTHSSSWCSPLTQNDDPVREKMFAVRTCAFQTRHSMRNPVVYDELSPTPLSSRQEKIMHHAIDTIHWHALLLYSWNKTNKGEIFILWGWNLVEIKMFPATCIWSNRSAGYSCYRSCSLHHSSTVTNVVTGAFHPWKTVTVWLGDCHWHLP